MPDVETLKKLVQTLFPRFGVNKERETVRLVWEICKKENADPAGVLEGVKGKSFAAAKKTLVARRYPEYGGTVKSGQIYLPKLEINPSQKADTSVFKINPKIIYAEQDVAGSFLASRFRMRFPDAKFETITSLKSFIANLSSPLIDYHRRGETFFIVKERFDFTKACPCAKGAVRCGYDLLNIGFGCLFECAYCFLQEYQNVPGIIFPADIDDFFRHFAVPSPAGIFPFPRIGTGEFTDSLIFDDITEFSSMLADFFRRRPGVYFEFKTKSANVAGLLKSPPAKNIVISWSVNPQKIIDENEFFAADLHSRVAAAALCSEAGFSVGFHFDPIIYYKGWEADYENVVNLIFDRVKPETIAWISMGMLRFNPGLKRIIENRFPESKLTDEELFLGFDGKMRYSPAVRESVYGQMADWIRKRSGKVPLYLCMESEKMVRNWK